MEGVTGIGCEAQGGSVTETVSPTGRGGGCYDTFRKTYMKGSRGRDRRNVKGDGGGVWSGTRAKFSQPAMLAPKEALCLEGPHDLRVTL